MTVRRDFRQDLGGVGQQFLQPGYGLQQFLVLVLQAFPLQGGQPAELHVQDGLGLHLGQLELVHQVGAGGLHVRRVADGGDDLVQVVQGQQ